MSPGATAGQTCLGDHLILWQAISLTQRAASLPVRLEIHSLHDLGWFVRQGVHFGLFMGALAGQGSDDQRAEWLAKVHEHSLGRGRLSLSPADDVCSLSRR